MAEIIVDQKATAQLPYDPNVIPPAVRARAAQVEALYNQPQSGGDVQPPEPPVAEPIATPDPAPAPQAQDIQPEHPAPAVDTPAPATAADPSDDPNSNSWKHQALAMKGRLEQTRRELGEIQEQYYQEVMRARQQPQQQQRRPAAPPQYLRPEDEENFGRELLDVAQRAALQAVTPKIQTIEEQNAELKRQLARERRRALDQAVEVAVPNFREIDANPRWHRWLTGIDLLSGRVRQTLLDEAVSAGSAPRVISFFKSFQNEEAATGHVEPSLQPVPPAPLRTPTIPLETLAAPGRGRPAAGGETPLPPEKPFYTRAQIKSLYEQHRKGAYIGREAEWARLDADIIAAGREGRIR